MDINYINESKENYAITLLANGQVERSKKVMEQDAFTPIFEVREVHPQAEPIVKDYNEMVMESYVDLSTLITCFRDCSREYYNLMLDTKHKLESIKLTLLEQKEKLDDSNILCSKFTDFNKIVTLDTDNLIGDFSYDRGILSAAVINHSSINFKVDNVSGNGYEGNKYVYNNDVFVNDTIDTNNRNYINDRSEITVYEYSRLTASNSEQNLCTDINIDSIEAKCIITLSANSTFNKILVKLSSKDTILCDLAISYDGVKYESILKEPINIFSDYDKYNNKSTNYIYNSGLLCFPSTQYLKIVLQSNAITDDIIAFEKTEYVAKDTKAIESNYTLNDAIKNKNINGQAINTTDVMLDKTTLEIVPVTQD